MIKKIKLIMTFGLILLLTSIFGDTTKLYKNECSIPTANMVKTDEQNTLTEEEAYKMLYDNQVKSNDAILKTIFYALAGIASAIIFVIAANWWSNEKRIKDLINDIDGKIKSIKKETLAELSEKINTLSNEKTTEINQAQNKLQEEVTSSINQLSLIFNEFTVKIRGEIKEDNKALSDNYQKQLEAFNENYRQQISSLNEIISSVTSNLKETISSKEELLKGLINSESRVRKSSFNDIKAKIFRNEAWMWEGRGVHNNTITSQLAELELRVLTNGDLTFYLDHILQTAKKLTWFTSYNKINIKEILQKVPKKYMPIVEEILAITENLKESAVWE